MKDGRKVINTWVLKVLNKKFIISQSLSEHTRFSPSYANNNKF